MHILFTKSQNSSEILVNKFISKGHKATNFSIFNIKPIPIIDINFKNFSPVIFTSSNAIQNLKKIDNINHLKCFCVGEQTADAAKKSGFLNIQIAGGNYLNFVILFLKLAIKPKKNLFIFEENLSLMI